MLNSQKNMKIMSTFNFETPLQLNLDPQNLDPQSKKFFRHIVNETIKHNYFWEKSPTHNNGASKLN